MTLTFENLRRHIGHQIAAEGRGLPVQNVVLWCADCDEVLLDLDAEGETAHSLAPYEPPGPEKPPMPAVALALPVAA